MVFDCGKLHQAIGTVLLVQVEHPEDQPESGEDTEADADPPVNTYHIEDDEQQEDGKQASYEEIQVLCLQAVKLHAASYSFVDIVFHNRLYYRKKGAQDGRSNNEENTGSKPGPGCFSGIGVS